jgi:hypothetical protein
LEAERKGKLPKMPKLKLSIPSLLDFISSTLSYIAFNYIPGSVYLMFGGGTILTTLLFSQKFLKTKIKNN